MTPGGSPPEVETIVAIATPHGSGAIGVIRLSGPRAMTLADRILSDPRGRKLSDTAPRSLHRVTVIDPRDGASLDEALAVSMPGPNSYTGEDVVEVSCHGNPVLLGSLVERLCQAGARLAEPGEFTRRAYLNGRMSLLEAEAVGEIIAARSERALLLAARELKQGIEGNVMAVRERLLDLVAGLEVALDFPDDEVGTSDADAAKTVDAIARAVTSLVQGARKGGAIRDGLTVMLVGAPNVGKSSLLNALLGAERAIVSPTSGTTRDVVEGRLTVNGVLITLRDGAGLGEPHDALDAEAMRRTRVALGSSDLVVVVLDQNRCLEAADEEVLAATLGMERLVVANKSDLPSGLTSDAPWDCRCSARTGEGLAELSTRLARWVDRRTGLDGDEGGFVASIRVREALGAIEASLQRASEALGPVPVEAILVDLRHALGAVDSILGIGAEDALLDRVFSTFCVGK